MKKSIPKKARNIPIAKNIPATLGRREQQVIAAVARLGEASVNQVMAEIPHPPTYTTVRTILQVLTKKNVLQFRSDGCRYLYRVKVNRDSARTAAVKNLLTTFFPNNVAVAIATMLDLAGGCLNADEIADLQQKINQARKEDTP